LGRKFHGGILKDLVGSVLRMRKRFLGVNWANNGEIIGLGAKTGKVDDEDELEVDGDEEHTA